MSIFKNYEQKALFALIEPHLDKMLLDKVIREGKLVELSPLEEGYRIVVSHPELPAEKETYSRPVVTCTSGESKCAAIAFTGNRTLTLECHAWRRHKIPDNFRDQEVSVNFEFVPECD